jgi:dolichol-phosphate mannosyltransferase
MQKTIDIILPAYHEQDNIEKVINGINQFVKTPFLITVVIQDKNDPTVLVLKKIQKKNKAVQITYTEDGIGMLKALRHGIKATRKEIIVIMMSDLSDNPKDIDKMVKKINMGYDLVCASRYIKRGKRVGGPKLKGFLSNFACISLRLLTKIPTSDSTNAFKCFKRTLINSIKIQSKEGFELPLEITVKAFAKGFKISEVPTIWRDRKKGSSKFNTIKNLKYYLRWYMLGVKNAFLFK